MKSTKILVAGILIVAANTFTNAQVTTGTTVITSPPPTGETKIQNEADNTQSKAFSFGVKGGVNFSSVAGDDIESPKARTSFHVGVLGELPISNMFSLQVEALYSGQGFETESSGELGENIETLEYQIDYINVPILAKIYATTGLSFEVGPQFNFKINEEFDNEPNENGGDTETDLAEDFGVGVAGGVTFTLDLGIFASARYTYGFTDILREVEAHNSVFQIGVGYKF